MKRADIEALPAGVSWENSPLFDFGMHPKLSAFPDLCRILQVGWLAIQYSEVGTLPKQVSILDAACGFGELYSFFRSQRLAKDARIKYVGVEVDPRKEERSKKLMPSIDFRRGLVGDLLEIIGDERFDIVCSTETLEHLEKQDGEVFLKDCMKALKPGGFFILTVPSPALRRDNPWHLHEWERPELLSFIEDNGWEVMDIFSMKSTVRLLPDEIRKNTTKRVPNEMLRGVLSPMLPEGSITVAVLRAGETT